MKALLIDAGNTRIRLKAWPGSQAAPAVRDAAEPLSVLAEYATAEDADAWLEEARSIRAGADDPGTHFSCFASPPPPSILPHCI